MSEAFDRAMNEMDRVWDASEKFDTKVLQFVGFVIAGFLAGAGAVMTKLQLALPLPPVVLVLLIVGMLSVLVFVAVSLRTVIGYKFKAPLDPEKLKDAPKYLTDDAKFEEALLPAIAAAHSDGVKVQKEKTQQFRLAFTILLTGVVCLLGACMLLLVQHNRPKGGVNVNGEGTGNTTSGGSSQGSTQPAPQPTTTTTPLGPYTVDRGLPDSSGAKK